MVQTVPGNLKEQSFLLTSVARVPWTRLLVGLLLYCQLRGGPQDCFTYPVTSWNWPLFWCRYIYPWEPEAEDSSWILLYTHEANGSDRCGRIYIYLLWSTVTQLPMIWIKDCWVLWVRQPCPAHLKNQVSGGNGCGGFHPNTPPPEHRPEVSLFWKHAEKEKKNHSPFTKKNHHGLSSFNARHTCWVPMVPALLGFWFPTQSGR